MFIRPMISKTQLSRRSWRLVTYLYALGILFFSLQPDLRPPGSENIMIDQVKNWLHVPAYAGLTFLLLCSFGQVSWQTRIAAFAIATSYGIMNEWFQLFVPGRSCSWEDAARNALGALLMIWLFR